MADSAPARKRPRFLGDSGDEGDGPGGGGGAPTGADFDALFDLDDDLPAPLVFSKPKPAAPAKAADPFDLFGDGGGLGGDGEEGEGGATGKVKKKRAPRPKIDEARLTGPKGFDALRADLAGFKSKGKGKEVDDLHRLMAIYQLWAHRLFPSANFSDAVAMIETVCRKRGMTSALRGYRDEAKGIKRPKPGAANADEPEDEPDRARSVSIAPFGAPARPASPPAASARRPVAAADDDLGYDEADLEGMMDEDDDALEAMRDADNAAPARPRPPAPPAARPPPSTARSELDRLFDDEDEDEVLREMENAPAASVVRPPVVDPLDALLDDEMDFDALDALNEVEAPAPVRPAVVEADLFDDLDEDALAALDEAPAAAVPAAKVATAVENAMDEDLLLSDADLAALVAAEQSVVGP